MNRIIKFRAWQTRDREKGFMNYEVTIGYLGDNMVGADSSDILMQFINLRDMDRNDIYEGDILQDEMGIRTVVKWDNFRAGWSETPSSIKYYGWKIIGNIYENPELTPAFYT